MPEPVITEMATSTPIVATTTPTTIIPPVIVPSVTILPNHIIQGDPVMVVFSEAPDEVLYKGKKVPTFIYKDTTRIFLPVDFTEKPASNILAITWQDGATS